MSFSPQLLEQALDALGQVLADRGQPQEVVAIGGASLLLLGLIQRPTKDIDLVALVGSDGYLCAEPLPAAFKAAIKDVGAAFDLGEDWINAGPADLLRLGLPEGFEQRTVLRSYGALVVQIASRFDQICFKLYASVDCGPRSKHFADLRQLEPTPRELARASAWCSTHDPSPAFADQLDQVLPLLRDISSGDADDPR